MALGLDRRVHRQPLEVPDLDRAGLVRHRETFPDQGHELLLARRWRQRVIDERSNGSVWQKLSSPQKYW
jgi:hypothetical protein